MNACPRLAYLRQILRNLCNEGVAESVGIRLNVYVFGIERTVERVYELCRGAIDDARLAGGADIFPQRLAVSYKIPRSAYIYVPDA